jgi:predicted subunit of tRNA(5-methylaminomethyl-2-thiouridylate) methyltransferase
MYIYLKYFSKLTKVDDLISKLYLTKIKKSNKLQRLDYEGLRTIVRMRETSEW